MKQIKSISITKITSGNEMRWCSRLRFTDGSELFAGADNIHGKAVAEASHKNTYAMGLRVGGTPCLPFSHNPITRERVDHWQALPDGWSN